MSSKMWVAAHPDLQVRGQCPAHDAVRQPPSPKPVV
jgi:hypothetical protein